MAHSLPGTVIPLARIRRLPSSYVFVVNMLHQRVHVAKIGAAPVPATDGDLFMGIFIVRIEAGGAGD